jgi:hypothetical protein
VYFPTRVYQVIRERRTVSKTDKGPLFEEHMAKQHRTPLEKFQVLVQNKQPWVAKKAVVAEDDDDGEDVDANHFIPNYGGGRRTKRQRPVSNDVENALKRHAQTPAPELAPAPEFAPAPAPHPRPISCGK